MAVYENQGILSYKDESGDIQQMFPVTDLDLIRGIDSVKNHLTDKSNPHDVELTDFGVTVGADKINLLSKLKSDVQTQIDQLSVRVDSSTGSAEANTQAILKAVSDGDAAVTAIIEGKLNAHISDSNTRIDAKSNKEKATTVTLPLSAWSVVGDFFSQDVSVPGVTTNNTIIHAPSTSYMDDYLTYAACRVTCAEQSANSLKFLCWTKPDRDLHASVVILNA